MREGAENYFGLTKFYSGSPEPSLQQGPSLYFLIESSFSNNLAKSIYLEFPTCDI